MSSERNGSREPDPHDISLPYVDQPDDVIALTALRGRVNVKDRVLEPRRHRDVLLDECRYLALEHCGVTR